ncbi:L-dopachrome tautomerase-related protein [Variovorax sp. tm]|uniref:L-dopachrome tautomerase-related protein n=1 Tax=Variovorax atrisoli TaxID=3394203 RepID=UPI003A805B65
MLHRSFLTAAFALAALLALSQTASAASGPRLERWRSYAGVSWQPSSDSANPAPFAGSVDAPIAGLHFDANGTAYVSTPRLISAGAPATLSKLDTRARTGPARLTAFPSVQANAIDGDPQQSLRNVLGFHVDRRNGWLWAVDMGFIAGEPEAPEGAQKVLVIDLASGRTVKRIPLDGVANRRGSFLNDIAVDERRRVAYISDSGMRSAPHNMVGLIVIDLASNRARRVLDKHPTLQVEPGVKVVSHGSEVWPGNPLLLGINGIALSPDGRTLYWTVTTGTRAHAIPTAVLRKTDATEAQLAASIRDLGAVGGNTDGIVVDAQGDLYITDVTRNGIVRYSPRSKAMSLMAADERVLWPDTLSTLPGGDLVFTSSALNEHFAGSVKGGEERYDLWRLPVAGSNAKAR